MKQIPKVIHYIWLGGNPEPEILQKCKESWKKYCPDYEIKRWDESNLDLNKYQFAKDAYEAKKWAFASDVFRFDVLFEEGGIYLDTDVEVLKNIDEFLKYEFFSGFENDKFIAPGLIIGCKKGAKIAKDVLEIYKNTTFDIENLVKQTVCILTTNYLVENYNLKQTGETQYFDNGKVAMFASDYFCPMDVATKKVKLTKNTYTIHLYAGSWVKKPNIFKRTSDGFKHLVRKMLGNKLYEKIKQKLKKENNG